ncbi:MULTISPECIES: YbgA family protein [unclassified Enterococcus]|uniref:DUF1722 domain-containing protein n=1 Tax=Candidatus Enterococcus dunnyi TaxID=1834192 RepID=A0A200J8J8_9ENTE|nr:MULTISPECIES: YbgA family protein [unclassified Enterococcus]OUZ32937.1 hypothetical protein A5889_001646 [Enterococcus sp. 9D6_DIV0238]
MQKKERDQLKEMTKKQQEWASLKYLILSKSQNDYNAIRKLVSEKEWNEEKEALFQSYLQHALTLPDDKGSKLNAYQHVWGYFKKLATAEERKTYSKLLDDFSLENDQLWLFLKELILTYDEPYLRNSKLFFP